MKHLFSIIALSCFSLIFGQEKNYFTSGSELLKQIIPNGKPEKWLLIYNDGETEKELRNYGKLLGFETQSEGFRLDPYSGKDFYYIVVQKSGKTSYIKDLETLKQFIGKADNFQEAVLLSLSDGYFIDYEFNNIAGNYWEDDGNYYFNLGKVTSTECPYQKTHYILTVSKTSGEISDIKDLGTYIEVYQKKCTNNPRLLKLKREPEPEPEKPKKSKKNRSR